MQGAGTGFTTTPSDGLSMPMAATDDPHPEWTNVDRAVLAQVATIGPRHVLLVGDSLTYNNPTGSICGWPAVKAGYVNATWQEVRDRPLWGQFASRAAIVMLGTNNALRGTAVTEQEMQQLLGRLTVEQRIVATPPPLEPPAATPPVLHALTEVQTLVLALPYPAIDTRSLSDASFFTPDGIHLTAQGYATLNPLMEQSPVCQ